MQMQTASPEASAACAPKPPSKREIDELVREYAADQKVVDGYSTAMKVAKQAADEKRERLIAMVQTFGVRHAEKSMRLMGDHTTATVTTGTQTTVDAQQVEELRGYLDSKGRTDLTARFFSTHISYQLVDGPMEVLKELDLGSKFRQKLLLLLGRCFRISTKAPSLKVTVADVEPPE